MDDDANNNDTNNAFDPFLSTMTFAKTITTRTPVVNHKDGFDEGIAVTTRMANKRPQQQHRYWNGDCDCSDDECRPRRRPNNSSDPFSIVSYVPETIQNAIDHYKLQKKRNEPIRRRQVRNLLYREYDNSNAMTSVWEWILPMHAVEPIIEYYNPNVYRIIYIQHLSYQLQSIGKGIIGSYAEEKTRTLLDWQEGDVLLLHTASNSSNNNNNTKAIGWVHVDNANNAKNDSNNVPSKRKNSDEFGNDDDTDSDDDFGSSLEKLTTTGISITTSNVPDNPSNCIENSEPERKAVVAPTFGGPAVLYILKIPADHFRTTTITSSCSNNEPILSDATDTGSVIQNTSTDVLSYESTANTNNNNNNERQQSTTTSSALIQTLQQLRMFHPQLAPLRDPEIQDDNRINNNNIHNKNGRNDTVFKFNPKDAEIIKSTIRNLIKKTKQT